MVHLWLRSESRPNEQRTALTPAGVAELRGLGFRVTVEESLQRILPLAGYTAAGAEIAPQGSWPDAPPEALILGIKELPESDRPLIHRHIMFGHAYKGQPAGLHLLGRLKAGGGRLYDLEYLTRPDGRRLAAFGYWAGFAGAAVSLKAWAAQKRGGICPPVRAYASQGVMTDALLAELDATGQPRPNALVVGALGRVGSGASDLLSRMGVQVTRWDMAETAHGGPFPEIAFHDLFINCILAQPGAPVFVGPGILTAARRLSVIGDVACDPDSAFNPIPLYDHVTDWGQPALRVAQHPPLDIMAIDNLPSLLPLESSTDFARQLLPVLKTLDRIDEDAWGRAAKIYESHIAALG